MHASHLVAAFGLSHLLFAVSLTLSLAVSLLLLF